MPDQNFYESYERLRKRRHPDDPRPAPRSADTAKRATSPKKKMGFFKKIMTGLALSGAAAYGYGAYETQDALAPAEATVEAAETAWNAPVTQRAIDKASNWARQTITDFNKESAPAQSAQDASPANTKNAQSLNDNKSAAAAVEKPVASQSQERPADSASAAEANDTDPKTALDLTEAMTVSEDNQGFTQSGTAPTEDLPSQLAPKPITPAL